MVVLVQINILQKFSILRTTPAALFPSYQEEDFTPHKVAIIFVAEVLTLTLTLILPGVIVSNGVMVPGISPTPFNKRDMATAHGPLL